MKQPMVEMLLVTSAALVALAACGGKVIVDAPGASGAGGSGGGRATSTATGLSQSSSSSSSSFASSSSSFASSTVGSSSVASTATATTGGGPPCDPMYTCSEAIAPMTGKPNALCDGTLSKKLYLALKACVCGAGGACQAECGASVCNGQMASPPCVMCIQSMNGCGQAFTQCSNDQ